MRRHTGRAAVALALALLAFLVVGVGSPPAASPSVTVIDLGTLGGSNSFASAVNDRGQVVGSSLTAGNACDPCLLVNSGGRDGRSRHPRRQDSSAGAVNAHGKPDQDPVDLADCRTRRNLSAHGRADARTIGSGVRRLNLRVGAVLASLFCRTKETARLAFGRFTVDPALLNTIVAEHDSGWRRQIRAVPRLLGTKPAPGTHTVLVAQGSVVGDTTGQTLEEGETLVFCALGSSRFRLLGRILPREWRTLLPA